MLCGLGYDLSCQVGNKLLSLCMWIPWVVRFLPSGLSAALEISFIVKVLSVEQYEASTSTGAPG